MRTTIAAAALLTALAACGGDDGGYSMTEPNSIAVCAGAPLAQAEFYGTWSLDWGCIGTATASGATPCDPSGFVFLDTDRITLSPSATAGNVRVSIAGVDVDGHFGADGTVANTVDADFDGGSISIRSCGQGSLFVEVIDHDAADFVIWGADAHVGTL